MAIILALLSCAVYFMTLIQISNIKCKKKSLLLSLFLCAFIISMMVHINPSFEALSGFVFMIIGTLLLIYETKLVLFNICCAVFSMIIMYVGNIILAYALLQLGGYGEENARSTVINYLLSFAIYFGICYVFARIIRTLIQKKDIIQEFYLKQKHLFYFLSGFILVLVFFYYLTFISPQVNNELVNAAIILIISIGYLFFLLTAVYMFMVGVKRSIEMAHNQEMNTILHSYTANLEEMYDDMRKFRHDYTNIIGALYGYIEKKDMAGIEDYFMGKVMPVVHKIEHRDSTLDRLKKIHIPEVKGLLALKLMQAQEKGIQVHIEVSDDIHSIKCNTVNFTRIIGILLDNAIEACAGMDKPFLNFGAFTDGDNAVMLFVNGIEKPIPPVSEMFKKGFSTKGNGRGLGLHIVRELIAKQETDIYLNTLIKENQFIQELRLRT